MKAFYREVVTGHYKWQYNFFRQAIKFQIETFFFVVSKKLFRGVFCVASLCCCHFPCVYGEEWGPIWHLPLRCLRLQHPPIVFQFLGRCVSKLSFRKPGKGFPSFFEAFGHRECKLLSFHVGTIYNDSFGFTILKVKRFFDWIIGNWFYEKLLLFETFYLNILWFTDASRFHSFMYSVASESNSLTISVFLTSDSLLLNACFYF